MITQEKISADVIELQKRLSAAVWRGQKDPRNAVHGTSKIAGYVCNIHSDDEEDVELRGTVDVQEYAYRAEDYNGNAAGFHEGVMISAIQGNKGYRIVPCMFSEVIIQQDPSTLQWYVTMYSHATIIDLNAHDEVNISVTEYEDFEESDDGLAKDYDELEETGNKTSTNYTATSIIDQVVSPDDKEGLKQEKTAEHKIITVGKTKIVINGNSVTVETSDKISVKGNAVKLECSTCDVKADTTNVDGGNVSIKGNVTIKGGSLKTQGTSSTDLNGPFNAIKVCPFSGAPHCGSSVSGT